MQSDTLLHVANFSTLFVCMVLKFPQIFVLMRAKSSTGVSLNSLLFELVGYESEIFNSFYIVNFFNCVILKDCNTVYFYSLRILLAC